MIKLFENIGTLSAGDGENFGVDGYRCIVKTNSTHQKLRMAEAGRLWMDVMGGRTDPVFLKEAFRPRNEIIFAALCAQYPGIFPTGMRETMTTSDFDVLTVDILDRVLMGTFDTMPQPWRPMVKIRPLRDFRTVSRKAFDGMQGRWSSVPEGTPHPTQSITPVTPVTYAPLKYLSGNEAISWEAMMNDELGIFRDLTDRLARGGNRTLEYFATSFFVDANGPHASLYSAGNANIISIANGATADNPPFSIAGLQDAFTVLMKKVDSGGDPIAINGKLYLWYGPDLFTAVEQTMSALTNRTTTRGGTSTQELEVRNWWASRITPVMNQYIPRIATTNGKTSWGLVADPNMQERPAVEIGILPGYDSPVLLQKQANTLRGGAIAQDMGDFNTMVGHEFKGLMVFGGAQISGVSTVASNGTNS